MTKKLNKFSRKYSWFISEASEEEIVSISKELFEVMSQQIKSLLAIAPMLLAVCITSLIATLWIIFNLDAEIREFERPIELVRIMSVGVMCLGVAASSMALDSSLKSSSSSALMWRRVRETADDQNVYEQRLTIVRLNKMLNSIKNRMTASIILTISGVIIVALTYVVIMLSDMGYI